MAATTSDPINHAVAKAGASIAATISARALPPEDASWQGAVQAWLSAIGITSWETFGAFAAALLTCCFLAEWWWKRFWKPLLRRLGWMKPARTVLVEAHESDLTPLEGGRRRRP